MTATLRAARVPLPIAQTVQVRGADLAAPTSARESAREQAIAAADARFWRSVEKRPGADGCWIWKGKDAESNFAGRRFPADRLAWELTGHGSLDRIRLERTCGTERCVNPAHQRANPQPGGRQTGRPPVGVLDAIRKHLALHPPGSIRVKTIAVPADRAEPSVAQLAAVARRAAPAKTAAAMAAPAAPAVTRPAAQPAPRPAPPQSAAELLRSQDTEIVTFLNRPGVLTRVFPGGATVITDRGTFFDDDLRRAVQLAQEAERGRRVEVTR